MEESYKIKGMRKSMIDSLDAKYKLPIRLKMALEEVPRHLFLDSAFAEHAYQEKAFNIIEGQTISNPSTVVQQTMWLDLKQGMKVLEIGTGSGFQCGILCKMGMEVYSVERIEELSKSAETVLNALDLHPHLKVGDGTLGWQEFAPYDRILVTAAAPEVPESYIEQLSENAGILVIPVGDLENQVMQKISKNGTDLQIENLSNFKFVPLLGKKGW